jgi:hypothetical protein
MKILFSLFAIVMLAESCNSSKEVVTNSKEVATEAQSKSSIVKDKNDIVQSNYSDAVTYKAQSRGSFIFIQITGSQLLFSEDVNLQNVRTFTCEEKDVEEIARLLKAVNKETFQKLEAPTGKRLYDGAAHATLAIRQGDVEIITPTFDHGHPPQEIETLVNKVLSTKESVVKQ